MLAFFRAALHTGEPLSVLKRLVYSILDIACMSWAEGSRSLAVTAAIPARMLALATTDSGLNLSCLQFFGSISFLNGRCCASLRL